MLPLDGAVFASPPWEWSATRAKAAAQRRPQRSAGEEVQGGWRGGTQGLHPSRSSCCKRCTARAGCLHQFWQDEVPVYRLMKGVHVYTQIIDQSLSERRICFAVTTRYGASAPTPDTNACTVGSCTAQNLVNEKHSLFMPLRPP